MFKRMFGSRNLTAKANSAATPFEANTTASPAPVKYAKVQLKSNNVRNWTGLITGAQPIHRAVLRNQPSLVQNLLKNPAVNPNNRTEGGKGYTPLMLAAMHNHKQIVAILLNDPRVDPTLRTKSIFGKGETAADLAVSEDVKNIIESVIAQPSQRGYISAPVGGRRRRNTRKGRKSSRRTRRR